MKFVTSYSFLVDGACNVGAADCPIGCYCCCCCCCWDILGSGDSDDNSSYEDEWSSLSELIASY